MASALDTLLAGTQTNTTTLPSWMNTAQQNIVNSATANAANIPSLSNTVAGTAINNLSGPNNPFTTAQSTLGTIASGAANPWITNPTTGAVTPNTNTALGGLFAADTAQLKSILPQAVASPDAAAIAGGNFGSLRNETAADIAETQAAANLYASQMQAALSNQQTGVNASTGLSNTGSQGTAAELALGQAQQSSPLTATADLANIINSINAPTTVTASQTPSLANSIANVSGLITNGGSLLNSLGLGNTISSTGGGILSGLSGLLSPSSSSTVAGSDPAAAAAAAAANPDLYNTSNLTGGSTTGMIPTNTSLSPYGNNLPTTDTTGGLSNLGAPATSPLVDNSTYTPIDTSIGPIL